MLVQPLSNEPRNQKQQDSIIAQLKRLLTHPVFKSSKRCTIFLRYVVERTLQGETEHPVKERSVGVEVFGREAGYDTNHDPIVRTTAGEVRKRIAQYYHEPGHESEIRIELIPPGSYVPEFFFPPPASSGPPAGSTLQQPSVLAAPGLRAAHSWHAPKWWWLAGLVLGLALLSLAAAWKRPWVEPSRTVVDEFWNPVLSASAPVLMCIGQPPEGTKAESVHRDGQQSVSEYIRTTDHIALSDGIALADLAGFLTTRARTTGCRVQPLPL
jgi:hypothetical protein